MEWNHGLGEIVGALSGVGMRVVMLEEHRSVPWNALPGQMVDVGDGEFSLAVRCEFEEIGLLTCGFRGVGVRDGEGSDAFVVYAQGCQGVDHSQEFIISISASFFNSISEPRQSHWHSNQASAYVPKRTSRSSHRKGQKHRSEGHSSYSSRRPHT